MKNSNINSNNNVYGNNSDSLDESDYILNKQNKINSIDKKRQNNHGFANPKRDFSGAYLVVRSLLLLLLLLLSLFFIKEGIDLYKINKTLELNNNLTSPVLKEITLLDDIDFINGDDKKIFFKKQINIWNESHRHFLDAKTYLKRDNINAAIESCHESLIINPANLETLELLIDLYDEEEKYIETINSVIRVLRIDSDRDELIQLLIRVLFNINDYESVIYLSEYYNNSYIFNFDVNLFYANTLLIKEEYNEALNLFKILNKYDTKNLEIINSLISIHMDMNNYNDALKILINNKEKYHRDEKFYYNYAICNAHLGDDKEVIRILSRASNTFSPQLISKWISHSAYDKFKQNRLFSIFVKRLNKELNNI